MQNETTAGTSQAISNRSLEEHWPSLPLDAWQDCYKTLHMWTQIVGKIRLKLSPPQNHWWHAALYVSTRGITTSPIPYDDENFELEFDFIDHVLSLRTSTDEIRKFDLTPMSVATFYESTFSMLHDAGFACSIQTRPQEVPDPVAFEKDGIHCSYDPDYVNRLWRIMVHADHLMKEFRGGFIGKCSPVHFFWGSFDLAVTRFSGRKAPERKGVITKEAYSHEVSSCGFWPGSGNIQGAAFYAYAAPEPEGYRDSPILPEKAFYNPPTAGHILMYDDVRSSKDPDQAVQQFFQSTYEAAARLGKWDRVALER